MFIDLRYHLTTIIAIFLSLGIGILIGTAMIGDDGIVMEQQKIIAQIEDDLVSLRLQNNQFKTKISTLEADLLEQEQFVDQLFQDAITEKLTGLSCLWIPDVTEGNSDDQQLMQILQNAGLEITEFTPNVLTNQLAEDEFGDSAKMSVEENLDSDNMSISELHWDFCILLAQGLPVEMNDTFTEERIFRPIMTNLTSKKGIYQFVKSLSILKTKIQGVGAGV